MKFYERPSSRFLDPLLLCVKCVLRNRAFRVSYSRARTRRLADARHDRHARIFRKPNALGRGRIHARCHTRTLGSARGLFSSLSLLRPLSVAFFSFREVIRSTMRTASLGDMQRRVRFCRLCVVHCTSASEHLVGKELKLSYFVKSVSISKTTRRFC